jgi:hypothetical protein
VTHIMLPIHLYGENSFLAPCVNPAVIGEVNDVAMWRHDNSLLQEFRPGQLKGLGTG